MHYWWLPILKGLGTGRLCPQVMVRANVLYEYVLHSSLAYVIAASLSLYVFTVVVI